MKATPELMAIATPIYGGRYRIGDNYYYFFEHCSYCDSPFYSMNRSSLYCDKSCFGHARRVNYQPLTLARLKQLLDYDPDTGIFRWKINQGAARVGSMAGGPDTGGYGIIKIDKNNYRSSRLAWLYMTGRWPDQVDHKYGDRADNRWANLRDYSQMGISQNQRRAHSNNQSGYLGVSTISNRRYRSKPYQASIYTNGKNKYLGRYATREEAHEAYKEAKRIYHASCTI